VPPKNQNFCRDEKNSLLKRVPAGKKTAAVFLIENFPILGLTSERIVFSFDFLVTGNLSPAANTNFAFA
jgi:hypothetical protein